MKKILLVMTALLLWNCTDYADDWENSYGAIFGAGSGNGGNSASNEGGKDYQALSSAAENGGNMAPNEGASLDYGRLIDPRDGKEYRTIQIGSQEWMAENMNYETTGSYCYGNDVSNCTKYGRLYLWSAAMDSSGTFSTNGKGCGSGSTCSATLPVQGICPTGWHLPTAAEFQVLIDAVGGKFVAGNVLKSRSGWLENRNGTNAFGFSALPAGYRSYNGLFYSEGGRAHFWSSTECDIFASQISLYYESLYERNLVDLGTWGKDNGFSVRCVKD